MGPAAQGLPHTCLLAPRPGRAWEAPSFGLLPASCRGGVKGTHRGTAARSERCAGPALPPALQLAPGAEGGSPCPFHDGTQSSTAETLWPRVSRVTPSLTGGHPPPAVTVPPSSATRQRAAGQGCVGREHGGTPGTRTLQLGSWLPRGPSAHRPGPGAGGAIPREAAPPVVRPQASPQGHVRTPSSQRFWGDSCADGGSGPGGGSQQGPRKLQSIFPGGLGDGWHTATHGASPAPLYPEVSRGGQGF